MQAKELRIEDAQIRQPWTVPYSSKVLRAQEYMPHVLASHTVLHAMKSVGKLAAVFEALDHSGKDLSVEQLQTIKDMSADLMMVALRFANLYRFSLAEELASRVEEKNKVSILD